MILKKLCSNPILEQHWASTTTCDCLTYPKDLKKYIPSNALKISRAIYQNKIQTNKEKVNIRWSKPEL